MLKEKAKNCGVVAADVKRCLFHTWTWESMKCSTGSLQRAPEDVPEEGQKQCPCLGLFKR